MESLIEFFGCGYVNNDRGMVEFIISKNKDMTEKLIPFFDKYKVVGAKFTDYQDFKKVAELMKNGAHLTSEGLEEIRLIKAGMNRRRK
jgi:hypothetical protein